MCENFHFSKAESNYANVTFWLREHLSFRRSSGSRLIVKFPADKIEDPVDIVDRRVLSVLGGDTEEEDIGGDVADDGCEPSNKPCISFCDRPDTSKGVVCPFIFVVV